MRRFCAVFVALIALVGCAEDVRLPVAQFAPVEFSVLPGWGADKQGEALAAFVRGCDKGIGRAACAAAKNVGAGDDAARAFFEAEFTPYAVSSDAGDEGLFTGYYVPELRGAKKRGGKYQTPLYARPKDRVTVDLGAFYDNLRGKRITGKVKNGVLVPYDDRASIAKGSLARRAKVLAWVDSPADAFFLAVQGSGIVRFKNGSALTLGYDGANGRGYVPIGRVLAERGAIARPVTMPAIRAWLAAHPVEAQGVLNENPSYVFYRVLPDKNVLGALGVPLSPQRSLAVDPAFIKLGTPLWLDSADAHGAPLQRLMVAQDTGGAIKGVVRGDFFWGAGDEAAEQAGAMQSRGRYFVLLPKGAQP